MTLRETLERMRSMPLPSNEEMAKIQIVLPVLRKLGWDFEDPDQMVYEYTVGAGGGSRGGGKADIALLSRPDRPVAIIEAKAPGQELNSRHVEQVLGYAYYEGVTICVLTNGSNWWLYLPREGGQPVERRFTELRLHADPLDDLEHQLKSFLGRKSLLGGDAEKWARKALEQRIHFGEIQRELPRTWSQMIGEPGGDDPDADLLKLVRRRFFDRVSLKPSDDQIAAVLRGRPVPPSAPDNRPSSGPRLEPHLGDVGSAKIAKPRRSTASDGTQAGGKPTGFELWGQHHPVSSFNDIPVGVAQALHDRLMRDGQLREFNRIGELHGKKHPYASRDRRDLRQPKRVGATGWYIDVHLSSRNAIRRAELFLRHFGYGPEDLQVLYSSQHTSSSTQQELPGGMPGRPTATRPGRETEPEQDDKQTGQRRTPRPTRKPTGFELWSKHYPVSRFNDISVGVAQAIHGRHPHDFRRIGELSGRTRQFASRNPDELFCPKPVGTTGWYIDVNLNGATHIERARLFLKHFGYYPDALRLIYD